METKELRIGNYYYLIGEDAEIDDVYVITDGYSLYLIDEYKNANPIPLNEQWLLDFGFKKRKNKHLFNWNNQITISQYIDSKSNYFFINNNSLSKKFVEIEYVHQIQNLYFALTGEELKLKTKSSG